MLRARAVQPPRAQKMRLRLGFSKDQIVRPAKAAGVLGVHRSTLWRWVRRGEMPPPIKLGPRVVGWRLETLKQFLSDRADEARKD